jgi:hypothetical protein
MDLPNKLEKVRLLQDWLSKNDCWINPKVTYPAVVAPGLLGMVANDHIGPGEVLTEVTPRVIFSTELLNDCEIQEVFEKYPDFFGKGNSEWLDNQFLALFLYEKVKKHSKWTHFFDVLPEQIENLCDWDDEELELLGDEDLVKDVRIRKVKNQASYERLRMILNDFLGIFERPVDLDEIEWSWKVIWTRSFMRSPLHSALVPFSDFVNHGESATSFYFSDQEESENQEELQDYDEIYDSDIVEKYLFRDLYEINFSAYENPEEELFEKAKNVLIEADSLQKMKKSVKENNFDVADCSANFIVAVGSHESYSPGQQIVFEYGGYSNTSLLIHYGFALENNRHEFVRLKVKNSDIFLKSQIKYLPIKYNPASFSVFLINSRELNKELVTLIRATLWSPKNKSESFFNPKEISLELKTMVKYIKLIRNFRKNMKEIDPSISSPHSLFAVIIK